MGRRGCQEHDKAFLQTFASWRHEVEQKVCAGEAGSAASGKRNIRVAWEQCPVQWSILGPWRASAKPAKRVEVGRLRASSWARRRLNLTTTPASARARSNVTNRLLQHTAARRRGPARPAMPAASARPGPLTKGRQQTDVAVAGIASPGCRSASSSS
ncbi:hypothetical protein BJY59DRAFT_427414 [Rhodotorula toruloides]